MRKNQSSVVIKVIFGVLTLVMIGFGINYSNPRVPHGETAAEVNHHPISRQQVQTAVSRTIDAYRQRGIPSEMLKSLNLKDQALDDLIRVALLRQEADRIGLEVTNDEVMDAILLIPGFQQNGRFSVDLYGRVLRSNNMKPSDFEELQREDLLVRKVQDLLLSGVYVSEDELKRQFDYENEQVVLRFVQIKAAEIEPQVKISEEQLQAFYDANKESFREPERVRAEIVTYAPSAFADKVTIEDDEVQTYFKDHASDFENKQLDEVKGEITTTIRLSKAVTLTRQAAEADHEKAASGEALPALAQASGGAHAAVGPVARTEPIPGIGRVPDLSRVLFATGVDQLGEVVETDTNSYLVKVVEKIPARIPELGEIKDRVMAQARHEEASKKAKERAAEVLSKLQSGSDLAAAAAAEKLEIKDTESFRRLDSVIPGLGTQSDLRTDAFKLTAEKPVAPQVYDLDGDAVVAALKEKLPADDSRFGDQKETLKSQLDDKRKRMVMEEFVKELKQRSVIRINPDALARVYLS